MFTFLNPFYVAGGLGLVSSPIIIRLIIEQMILLFLRCLLVVLALWLVARMTSAFGSAFGGGTKNKTVHFVLLDDSLSMTDKVADRRGPTCFDAAKKAIHTGIAAYAGRSSTPQDMVLVVLSELATKKDKYKPKTYYRLGEKSTQDELNEDLKRLQCSLMHIPLGDGVAAATKYREEDKDNQVAVHIVSDFRQRDWGAADSQALCKAVVQLANKDRTKIYMTDTAYPFRTESKAAPQHANNIGIAEFYPESRVAASGTTVRFWVVIQNFTSTQRRVRVAVSDPESGTPNFQADATADCSPGQTITKIDVKFPPDKEGWAQVAVKLQTEQANKLDDDGIEADNVRYSAIQLRKKVPVLIVDGDPKKGVKDGGDTTHVKEALEATAGYEVINGGVELLDQPNLEKYSGIYLLNVPTLGKEQEKNLKSYVRNGGNVAFFLGKDVDSQFYNDNLFSKDRDKNGVGLIPVELADQFFPPKDKPALKPDMDDGQFKILLRKEFFPSAEKFPVFGSFYANPKMIDSFKELPIRRYWPLKDLENWQRNPRHGIIDELATMPNEGSINEYAAAARGWKDWCDKQDDLKYGAAINEYGHKINEALKKDRRGNEKKLYELADVLYHLLNDTGDEGQAAGNGGATVGKRPNMKKFWDRKEMESKRDELTEFYKRVRFGQPLMVASHYGRGRVVVCTTTAGKEWNDWPGGAEPASFTYPPMILELQSYLTSLGSEANLTLGTNVQLVLDRNQYSEKITRIFFEPREPEKADQKKDMDNAAIDEKTGRLLYTIENTVKPGFYRFDLTTRAKGENQPTTEEQGYVFNVDTQNEGPLQRVSREQLETNLQGAPTENIKMYGPDGPAAALEDRQTDFSQSPLFYLIFLMVLIAEQALAVHLSFHLRDTETALPAQAIRSQAMA
jgi:hypothetical protein